MKTVHPNFVVGIGGSAGSLNAFKAFFDALPPDTGMAFVVVSHIFPTANSHLARILSRHTKMPTVVASTSMPVRANHVYVLAANADLLIESLSSGFALKVVSPRTGRNMQVDLFLISLADTIGERAIGIIFSGYEHDGALGCKHIKAKGGTIFAQDKSAEVDSMPQSAQATGCVDFVLPPEKIPDELLRLVSTSNYTHKTPTV